MDVRLEYLLERRDLRMENGDQTPTTVEQKDIDTIVKIAQDIKRLNERADTGKLDYRGYNKETKKDEGMGSDIVYQGYLLAGFIKAVFGPTKVAPVVEQEPAGLNTDTDEGEDDDDIN